MCFHPPAVCCTEPQLPLLGCNFYKLPPLSKWWNLHLQPLVISFFFSPTSFAPSCHPSKPPSFFFLFFFLNRGPSGSLLIYKCLCVLKCGTKGGGLWPLGAPTLCRFIVRRWERGFGSETPGHWPTHTSQSPAIHVRTAACRPAAPIVSAGTIALPPPLCRRESSFQTSL